jgi:preprotein translocase subunit SecD
MGCTGKKQQNDVRYVLALENADTAQLRQTLHTLRIRLEASGQPQAVVKALPNGQISVEAIRTQGVQLQKLLTSRGELGFYEVYEMVAFSGILNTAIKASYGLTNPGKSTKDELTSEDKLKKSVGIGVDSSSLEFYLQTPFHSTAVASVKISDTSKVNRILNHPTISRLFPADLRWAWHSGGKELISRRQVQLYALRIPDGNQPLISNKSIAKAMLDYNAIDGKPIVLLTMNQSGTAMWAAMTANNVNKPIAIVMDGIVISAPVVQESITGGQSQIAGDFGIAEVQMLAAMVNTDALPASLKLISQQAIKQ